MVFCRVCRQTDAVPVMLRASAGRIACRSLSARVTAVASSPMGTLRPTGKSLSQTPKIINKSSATQKAGVLAMIMDQPRISLSGQRPCVAPASTPRPKPSRPEITQASTSSQREFASFAPITVSTG